MPTSTLERLSSSHHVVHEKSVSTVGSLRSTCGGRERRICEAAWWKWRLPLSPGIVTDVLHDLVAARRPRIGRTGHHTGNRTRGFAVDGDVLPLNYVADH